MVAATAIATRYNSPDTTFSEATSAVTTACCNKNGSMPVDTHRFTQCHECKVRGAESLVVVDTGECNESCRVEG